MSFLTWFADTFGIADETALREKELAAAEARQAGLQKEQETYFGTAAPVVDSATGLQAEKTVGGTESHDQSGWSWLTGAWQTITGQTTTTAGVDSETGVGVKHVESEKSSSEASLASGRISSSDEKAEKVQVMDVAGMASSARGQLEARLKEEADSLTPEQKAKLEADIAALRNPAIDPATLRKIAAEQKLAVQEKYTTVSGTESKTAGTIGVDGLGVSGKYSEEQTELTGAGKSTTERLSISGDASAYKGSASLSGKDETITKDGNQTTTDTTSASGKIAAGGGKLTATGSYGESSQTVVGSGDSAKVTEGSSSEEKRSVSMIADGKGTFGVGAGSSSSTSTTKDDVTTSKTESTNVAITNKGVAADTSVDRKQAWGKDGSVSSKTSADGSFTVDVTPVPGSIPARYQVVMKLSANAALKLGATKGDATKGKPNGSVGASASAGVAMTYTHLMDDAEVARYMNEVDAAAEGGAGGSAPEFGMLSRLKALGDQADDAAMGGAAVLGSSEAAAGLQEGESVELTLTGAVSGNAKVGAGSAAAGFEVSGGAGKSWTRSISVTPVSASESGGRHLVDVKVTFVDAGNWNAGGKVSLEGATAGYAHAESGSATDAVVVRLDTAGPDYADRYHALCAAMDPTSLRGLAEKYTIGKASSETDTFTAGVMGAEMSLGTTTSQSESVTLGKDGSAEGTFSGGQTDKVAIGTADLKPLQASERNTATVTVDSSGSEAVLETETASSSPLRALGEGWDAMVSTAKGFFDGKGSAAEEVASAVAKSPEERLKEQLETTYADLERYQLSDEDIDVIAARAADTSNWQRCCNDLDVYEAWRGLGKGLVSPTIDPEWKAVNPTQAAKLARGRAIASFMAAGGRDAMDCMVNVLRYYGQNGGYTSAQDLGVHLQWPESLGAARKSYDTAHGRVRRADEELARYIGKPDGLSQAQAWYDDTRKKLDSAESAVKASKDITDRSARMEMIEACQLEKVKLEEAFDRNRHALESGVAESKAAPEAAAPVCSTMEDEEAQMSVGPQLTPEQVKAQQHVARLVALLAGYKAEEQAQLAEARGNMTAENGGSLTGWTAVFRANYGDASSIAGYQMSQLYETWISKVLELRKAYEAAGTPKEQWVVSHGPGEQRTEYEPDVEARVKILRTANENRSIPDFGYLQHIEAYRTQVNGY